MTAIGNKLLYPFRSGKNAKAAYFIKAALRDVFVPDALCRMRRDALIESGLALFGEDGIWERVDYYNKLSTPTPLSVNAPTLAHQRIGWKGQVYYFDTREFTRFFPHNLHWHHLPGDITHIPPEPTIVKSRPIVGNNANNILLNLNKVRHFLFVNDPLPFEQKKPAAVFRGKVKKKPKRIALFDHHFGNPLCDMGDTSGHSSIPDEWQTSKMTIRDQLSYQFILTVEGNDVASNLKWVMSSNSLALMPKPEYETWFMEGRLIPDFHYIELAPDFSDLEEKIRYYSTHPNATQKILSNAHTHVAQFRTPTRERLVSLLVMKKYFDLTNRSLASN